MHQLCFVVRLLHARRDNYLAALGKLHGVVAEVDQDLSQAQRIAPGMYIDGRVDIENQLQPLGRRLLHDQIANVLQNLLEIEIDGFDGELAGLDFGEIQDVVDDAEQQFRGMANGLRILALLFGHGRVE